ASINAGRRLARLRRSPAAVAWVPSLAVLLVLLVGQRAYQSRFPAGWTRLTDHLAAEARPGDGVAVLGPQRIEFDVAWSRVDGPRPDLVSLGRDHPLGS